MRFRDLFWFRIGLTITCALAIGIMSGAQFPGLITFSCICTIALCTKDFHESVIKKKNRHKCKNSWCWCSRAAQKLAKRHLFHHWEMVSVIWLLLGHTILSTHFGEANSFGNSGHYGVGNSAPKVTLILAAQQIGGCYCRPGDWLCRWYWRFYWKSPTF